MTRLTTFEVLKRCKIKSSKTLTRWYQRGLIPPPSIETHPSGRGKIAYWPTWVVRRIREVKDRLARGASLDQIAETLGSDWATEKKRWIHQRPKLQEALERESRIWATRDFAGDGSKRICDYLRLIGIQRPGISDELERRLSAPTLVDEALKLMQRGYSPVVAIVGDETRVIPDFLLATVVSHPESQGQPMLVIPIRDMFADEFAGVDPTLTDPPKYMPAMRVLERADKKSRVRKYTPQGRWGFTFED
jgi:hypothetical protein